VGANLSYQLEKLGLKIMPKCNEFLCDKGSKTKILSEKPCIYYTYPIEFPFCWENQICM
jgi:hypothetical protein